LNANISKFHLIQITFAENDLVDLYKNLEQCRILIINISPSNTCWSFNNNFDKKSLPNLHHVQINSGPILYFLLDHQSKILYSNHNSVNWQKTMRLQCVIKINFFVIQKHFEYQHIIEIDWIYFFKYFSTKFYIFARLDTNIYIAFRIVTRYWFEKYFSLFRLW